MDENVKNWTSPKLTGPLKVETVTVKYKENHHGEIPMKLSFTCIGRNEAHHLKELLPVLIREGDEVIYVDCESEDDSLSLARSMGCRVFQKTNNINPNINKSYAMEQARGDWIFYMDPDERLSRRLLTEIREEMEKMEFAAFQLPRKNYFFGRWLRHGGQYPDYQLRLFQREKGHFPNKHIHEKLQIDGPVGTLKTAMDHYSYGSVSQFLRKMDFSSDFEALYLYESGIRISILTAIKYFFLKPKSRILRRWIFKGGFLDGMPGFFAALFDGIGWMVRYFKLWELYKKNEKTKDRKLPTGTPTLNYRK